METVSLRRIDPEAAALLLSGVERFDPRGIADAADVAAICRGGTCFCVTHGNGAQVAYVLRERGGQVWIEAAAGGGRADLTATILETVEKLAAGRQSVAFQTARPGLVRKARRQGYRVAGWIMKKDIR